MKLKINGNVFDKWSNLSVSLIYDSICSTFSFDIYFDPYDKIHRQIMLPGNYNEAVITADSGETLLTGVLLSPSFKSSPVRSLVNISGYSRTGVLGDCEYAAVFTTAQSNGLSLYDLCQKVCESFGLGLNPAGTASAQAGSIFLNSNPNPTIDLSGVPEEAKAIIVQTEPDNISTTISEYIADIAKDTNIVLSHDNLGNLILTKASDIKPVYDFAQGMPGVQIELSVDGQMMHNSIIAKAQGGVQKSTVLINPYVQQRFNYRAAAINNGNIFNAPAGTLETLKEYSTGFRPHIVQQTSSDSTNIQDVAQQALAEELKAIRVVISMNGWTLNDKIVRPNTYVTIQNPECFLFNKTKFFIDRVDFSGDERQQTCVINCVVPEVYNGQPPINIFTANGNDTNFVEDGVLLRSPDRRSIVL